MACLILMVMCVLLTGCAMNQAASDPAARPLAEADWADDFDSYLYKTVDGFDLRLYVKSPVETDGRLRPAILFFFGGGFVNGSPGQFAPHCRYLAGRGMVAMTVDYRVKSRQDSNPVLSAADGRSAVRWVRANAAKLGVDPDRIACGGGSAGGGVASLTGVIRENPPAGEPGVSSRPDAMVLFNPVVVAAPVDGVEMRPDDRVTGYQERWGRAAIPEISAIEHITAEAPPTLILHGDADTVCPVETVRAFAAKMEACGVRCELAIYPGQGHGFFNRNRGDGRYYELTVAEMDTFLVSLGWLK